jgi:Uma2 family endonuclease
MKPTGKKPASYEDILALPDNVVGEIADDELFVSPRPRFGHAYAASVLGGELMGPFQRGRGGPGGWWIFHEVELHFGKDVLVPDLSGWRRERMPKPPPAAECFTTLAPDWVCEVISPSTVRLDYERKLPIYAREQVSWVWLVHPALRNLEVFHLQQGHWTLAHALSGDAVAFIQPFEAIQLELGALWTPEAEPAR